ncbi:metallophosphoesterase [Micromonospora sp. NPDC005220]|uniref:metallophosphoesterase family protein n=1 Tax=Micromonospora sp. NPDC005220 TaxID=3155589 RepID=UPI0033BC1BA0
MAETRRGLPLDARTTGSLYAVSDLHVSYTDNRDLVDRLEPESADDWLLVGGDVADLFADVERTLRLLRSRFGTVVWAPGNHELWTHPSDPVQLRGTRRYEALVRMCQDNGVLTPEDPYPVWTGPDGPVVVAPLFLLYDYSFRAPGTHTKEESLRKAYDAGVVCTDEMVLHPDPFPDRESWCWDRVARTEAKLGEIDRALPTVLLSHWPLIRQPTDVLWYPEFAQWCGTERTADWHVRFRATAAVYGHLHIPRTTHHDGVRFEEVSLGYPREWGRRAGPPVLPRRILAGPT